MEGPRGAAPAWVPTPQEADFSRCATLLAPCFAQTMPLLSKKIFERAGVASCVEIAEARWGQARRKSPCVVRGRSLVVPGGKGRGQRLCQRGRPGPQACVPTQRAVGGGRLTQACGVFWEQAGSGALRMGRSVVTKL